MKEEVNKKGDNINKVFSGTLVVKGSGRAEIYATGIHTAFGKIGTSLSQIVQSETRMQKEMKVLIRTFFLIGVLVSLAIILIFYLTRGNLIQSILSGLASAMAILPEEFPVVLTIFMALGSWRLSRQNVLTRQPAAIETLGSATVLCSDKTGTITQNKMEVVSIYDGDKIHDRPSFHSGPADISRILAGACHASPHDSVDPMEKAIVGLQGELFPHHQKKLKLLKEYALTPDLMAMTRVWQDTVHQPHIVSVKGAPEAIFSLCRLNAEEEKKHLQAVHAMAGRGYRVIGVATSSWQGGNLPLHQHEFDFSFTGLVGLEDPVRPEVSQAIKECHDAGIKVIMMTGDFPATARNIALQVGLPAEGEMITGEELRRMPDNELIRKIGNTSIFARVVPEQKLRIVQALKANHEIVAMTGDGVNDAPALKAAHIGIAMGGKGTDVAREASALVLLDDNFASIVAAMRAGRRIFDNLQKAMSYILAIHIPIIGLALMPALVPSLPLLLLPLHIIFMELIIDPVCSIAFETEQEEKGIMNRPPRKPDIRFFGRNKILHSLLQGGLLLTMVITVYMLSIREGHTEGEVRAIAFSSLIIGNIFLILTNLSKTRSVLAVITEKNMAAIIILNGALLLLLGILHSSWLLELFSFEFPGYRHFIPSLIGSGSMLLILEAVKFFKNRKTYFT
jgi:Ca2+-transporting ATPase